MAVSHILVPSNDLHGIVREAEAAERRRVEEKVDTWRKEINSAYHVILLTELRCVQYDIFPVQIYSFIRCLLCGRIIITLPNFIAINSSVFNCISVL